MATETVHLFVHAHFNTEGQFTGYQTNAGWKYDNKVSEYGLSLFLFQHDVQIEVPEDEAVLKGKAADVVEEAMKAQVAKHTTRMTALLGLKNRMLCLAAPDILDAGTSARGEDLKDYDDDIPF